MEKKITHTGAVALQMMFDRMARSANGGPGQSEVIADMKRLTDSVNSLAVLASNTDTDLSQEARQTRAIRAASKLGGMLPSVTERLDKLTTTTQEGFERAFAEYSGLITTERGAEIRAHLKSIKDPGERAIFTQKLLEAGDNESLGAVIFSPVFLSGLDAITHSRLRSQIEEQRLPELAKNREVFAELAGNLRVAISTAEAAVKDFSNPRKLAEIEEGAQRARQAEERLNASMTGLGGVL